jgi:hypothetical protein
MAVLVQGERAIWPSRHNLADVICGQNRRARQTSTQQLRQLDDIRVRPPRLIFAEQLGR